MLSINYAKKLGFSLIELVITVLVATLLAAIAFPTYQQHIVASKRKSAMNMLLSHAAVIERFKANHGFSYQCLSLQTSTCTIKGQTFNVTPVISSFIPPDTNSPDYELSVKVYNNGKAYELTANPSSFSSQKDDGPIVLHSDGQRLWNGQNCWPINNKTC
ncbi:MAG: type IV pilin protein [Pseudomonadota bacterium]